MASNPSPNLRIGDAERAEVSDLLGKHFSDGRLTEEEFRQRMDQAMSAKTHGDLSGLLSDLPRVGEPVAAEVRPRRQRRGRARSAVLVVFLVLVAVSISDWVARPHIPWILVGVVAFVLLRLRRGHLWHYHHHA